MRTQFPDTEEPPAREDASSFAGERAARRSPEIVAEARVLDLSAGLYSVRIASSGTPASLAGVALPAIEIAVPPWSRLEILGPAPVAGASEPRPGAGRTSWLGPAGGAVAVRAPTDGGCLIVTRYALLGQAGAPLAIEAAPLDGRPAPIPAAATGTADPEPQLTLERPAIVAGRVAGPVRSGFEIRGWATDFEGIDRVEASVDGAAVRSVTYPAGERLVVRAQFALAVPARGIGPGDHNVRVELRGRSGKSAALEFAYSADGMPGAEPWAVRRRIPQAEIELALRQLDALGPRARCTLLLSVPGNAEGVRRARATIASLRDQAYPDWRLALRIAGQGPARGLRSRLLDDAADLAERICVIPAGAADLADATGLGRDGPALFGLLRAGDELGCDALLEMVLAAGLAPAAEFFYSDERRRDPGRGTVEPCYKPQWSPDLLLSTNYIGRLWLARAPLLRRAGATLRDLDRFGEYDLVLRLTETARAVRHVPLLLCQRDRPLDTPAAERRALRRAMARRGVAAEVVPGGAPEIHRVRRRIAGGGRVSVIIPTAARRGLIKTCLESLRRHTAYRNLEILGVDNIPAEARDWKAWLRRNVDTVVDMPEPFNWSRFNNIAARRAQGEYLLFLNDDVEIIEPAWLDALVEHAQRPEVGVVGALLLYPDRKVQHAGMFLAGPGLARHAFHLADADDPGPFGTACATRNVIAVTGACMLVRRTEFERLGGFDEAHRVINNDLDYCLRSWRSGRLTVLTPHARLIHRERGSRKSDEEDYDAAGFDRRWRDLFAAGDPYFNPWLATDRSDYTPDWEPTRPVEPARPLLAAERVRRILVIKLDYIGDFVTGLAALRRLNRHFPMARMVMLAPSEVAPLVQAEPGIDEVLEFEFFYGRNGGHRRLSDAALRALERRLHPYHFDLAIDLRTRPETRPLLRCSGAKWLAGFDHGGEFPWLDIALEWEGETEPGAFGRQNIGEEFVRLVDAVATACETPEASIRLSPRRLAPLPDRLQPPYICVHPGAGIETKRWPLRHFAELIDLLAASYTIPIVLVGGAEETDLAARLLDMVRNRGSVVSLVGRVSLAELPEVLAGCCLFVGNDSGPKHIAAGLGVPTVAIHGGFGDAREFGPVGPNAVSMRREVWCSPCGIANSAECRRDVACLSQLGAGAVYRACEKMLALARQP